MLKGGDVISKQIKSGNENVIVIWQWRIDDKDWASYNDELCKIIEKLNINESYTYYIKSNINKRYIITKISKSTGIEKVESIQSNGDDTVSWKIRRITQKKNKYKQCNENTIKSLQELYKNSIRIKWQWKTNNDEWIPYNNYICNKIEEMDINQSIKLFKYGKQSEVIRDSKNTAIHIYKFELIESRKKCRRIEENIYLDIIKNIKEKFKNKDDEIQRLNERLKDKEKIIVDIERNIKDKDKRIKKQMIEIKELKEKEDELKELEKEMVVIWQWKKQKNNEWVNYEGNYNEKFERLDIGEVYEYTTTTQNKYKFIKKTRKNGELILMNGEKMRMWQVRRSMNGNIRQQKEIKDLKKEIINKDKENKDLDKIIISLRDEFKPKQIENKKQCIVYWEWLDDDNLWRSYPKDISKQIEKLKKSESMKYKFSNYLYKITKESEKYGIQNNIKTNKLRNIRRNKEDIIIGYAAPKLHSHSLQKSYIAQRFYKTVTGYKIIKIESIQNQMLYDSYYAEKKKMINLIGKTQLNKIELFHGTREDIMKIIEIQGFRKEFNSRAVYGAGTYFAMNAKYSLKYSQRNKNGIYKMFVCKVLCGEIYKGNSKYSLTKWPIKNNGLMYDSLVDNTSNPSIFVIHENFRAYPMFIIHFIKNN